MIPTDHTKFSMKKVNLETITDTLSWYKIQPLHGYNLVLVKRKLLRRRKGVYESFWSRGKSLKFILPIPWNLANLVKTCYGIFVRQPRRSETNGVAERAVCRIKEGTSAVLLQSVLDENWWAGSMECFFFCEMSKTSWQMGKNTL